MRLTRRGVAALAVAGAAVAMAWLAGPRSLNAVAAPLVVAVVAGAVQVKRTGTPTVERTQPRRGFPGETRSLTTTVEGRGVATIIDQLPDGIDGETGFEQTLSASVTYDLEYAERGVHEITRTTVAVRDVLGLVEETHEAYERTEVVVYPSIYSMGDTEFVRTLGPDRGERSEFDRLREYVPGDSLRDVHWKSSAKRDDLFVTEYTDPVSDEGVSIAGQASEGHADEMATAVATVFVAALRAGLTTAVTVPNGAIDEGHGDTHRKQVLELLARTSGGGVRDAVWHEADVRIRADATGVTVTLGESTHALADLTTTRDNPLAAEGIA